MKKTIREWLSKYYLGTLIDTVRRADEEIVRILIDENNLVVNDSEDRCVVVFELTKIQYFSQTH